MEQITICHYCKKEIKGRPFIPVRSNSPYHWKCYIEKIKDERTPAESIDDIEEPKADDADVL